MRICLVALLVACASPAAPVKPSSTTTAAAPRPAATDRGLEPPQPKLRLPRNFTPSEYAAHLAIDPAQTGFTGAIAITGEVTQRSSVFWLHGRKFAIKRAVAKRGSTEVALTAAAHGEDLLELRAASPLDAGTWTLAIDYSGNYELTDTAGAFKQVVRDAPYISTPGWGRCPPPGCARVSTSPTARCRGSSRSTGPPIRSPSATRRSSASSRSTAAAAAGCSARPSRCRAT